MHGRSCYLWVENPRCLRVEYCLSWFGCKSIWKRSVFRPIVRNLNFCVGLCASRRDIEIEEDHWVGCKIHPIIGFDTTITYNPRKEMLLDLVRTARSEKCNCCLLTLLSSENYNGESIRRNSAFLMTVASNNRCSAPASVKLTQNQMSVVLWSIHQCSDKIGASLQLVRSRNMQLFIFMKQTWCLWEQHDKKSVTWPVCCKWKIRSFKISKLARFKGYSDVG